MLARWSQRVFSVVKPFQALGLSQTASKQEIKDRFYTLAKQYHPDQINGNSQKFKEILEAYKSLTTDQEPKIQVNIQKPKQNEFEETFTQQDMRYYKVKRQQNRQRRQQQVIQQEFKKEIKENFVRVAILFLIFVVVYNTTLRHGQQTKELYESLENNDKL